MLRTHKHLKIGHFHHAAELLRISWLFGPGGMANRLRDWLPLIRDGLFAKPYGTYQVEVVVSTIGEQAGLYGAASLWD